LRQDIKQYAVIKAFGPVGNSTSVKLSP
jgi:hypothetical protein